MTSKDLQREITDLGQCTRIALYVHTLNVDVEITRKSARALCEQVSDQKFESHYEYGIYTIIPK